MTCLWRCPALIRTCFRWSLMYTVIFVFFKINSRNICVILIYFGCSMQVGGRVQSRWDLIYTALRGGFKSSLDIRVRILIQCIPIKTEKILEIQWFFCLYIYSWSLIYTVIKVCVTPCYSRNGHTGARFTTKKRGSRHYVLEVFSILLCRKQYWHTTQPTQRNGISPPLTFFAQR